MYLSEVRRSPPCLGLFLGFVPVVLFSIRDGVVSLQDLKRVGSVGVKTFLYYMVTTAIAVVIGLVVVNMFKGYFPMLPSAELNALEYTAKESPSVMQIIVDIFPDNLLAPMVEMDGTAIYLAVCVLCSSRVAMVEKH